MALKNVMTRLPEELVEEIDEKVDRIQYRTRTHFFEVALRKELRKAQNEEPLGLI